MFRRASVKLVHLLLLALLAPSVAYAQGSIAGVVKDASGAVLPGTTVEASSPVLIEKVRAVVTDGTGQYKIVDLRPGTYSVSFTLTGFSSVRREGIELTGSFTANVNADLKVGAVEETITVTGQSPTVDVQNVVQQKIMTRCCVTLWMSTVGASPVTVMVSSTAPTFSSTFTAAANDPVSSMPSRFTVEKPGSVKVTT